MSGIPGTVGAAPVQNIGAYGQEIVQTLVEVELIDEDSGEVSVVPAAELGLGFRTSALKHHYGSAPAPSRRHPLGDARARRGRPRRAADRGRRSCGPPWGSRPGDAVTVAWIRDHVIATRRRKGMVLDDADPDTLQRRARSSRTRSCRHPSRGRCPTSARAGRSTPDLDPVLVIPLAAFDGYVPPPAAHASPTSR